MITRARILERLAELREQREQLLANANAVQGAIQDCEFWLSILDAPSLAPAEPDREEAT